MFGIKIKGSRSNARASKGVGRRIVRSFGLWTAVAAVLLGVVVPVASVSAQATTVRPPLNLMTSPLPLNVITKPGKSVTADLRVKNNGTRPEQLKIELLKFGAEGDTGRPQLKDREPQDQYFNWISFSETNFTAEPNVWKTIKMTVNPPKEAAFGYYYAVLFTRAVPDKPTGGNTSAVEGGLASLVLLTVDAPGARREAKVAELVATQKVYEFLPAKFTVKLKNAGNVHVSPAGTMFIKRGNTQVGTISFNGEHGNILPGTSREFDMNWSDGFPSYVEKGEGENKTRELKWDFGKVQNLRFGRYTATLVAVYDDGQRDVPIEAVVSFWVIPWRILGIILLIILLVGGGIWGIMRLVWRGIKRQAVVTPISPAAAGPAPAPEPVMFEEPEPDPSSLAAALKRNSKKEKRAKKKAEAKAADQEVQALQEIQDTSQSEVYEEPARPVQKAPAKKPVPAYTPTPQDEIRQKELEIAERLAQIEAEKAKLEELRTQQAAQRAEDDRKRKEEEKRRKKLENEKREKAEKERLRRQQEAEELAARQAREKAQEAARQKTLEIEKEIERLREAQRLAQAEIEAAEMIGEAPPASAYNSRTTTPERQSNPNPSKKKRYNNKKHKHPRKGGQERRS